METSNLCKKVLEKLKSYINYSKETICDHVLLTSLNTD